MKYSVGFARMDVTPHLGVPINGYFDNRKGSGVLDPLYANAVAFSDGEKSAVILVLDCLGLYGTCGYTWPGMIEEELGLQKHSVILSSTHSHTTPSVNYDKGYHDWLYRRLVDTATLALQDLKPLRDVQWVQERAEGLTFPRRYLLNDGTVMTNPSGQYVDMIVDFACENDDSLRVVRFLREDAPEIVLVNFQTHPDNIGGDYYSADYPGAVRNRVEQLRPDTRCIFINGAEGQMVPGDKRKPIMRACHQRAMLVGNNIADFALSLFDKTVSTNETGLSFGQSSVMLKTKRDSSRVPEAKNIIKLHDEGKDDQIHPFKKMAMYMLAESRQIVRLERDNQDYISTFVSAIAFCGFALAGIPGEPFNEVGIQIRKNSKFPATCVSCQANGCHGYYPTANAYDQGGYEAYNTPYVKGTAEQLADTADQLLATL